MISGSAVMSKGVVIADDKAQIELFNSDSTRVLGESRRIAGEYNHVVIHLGRWWVFRKGNLYSTEVSQQNLRLFCEDLQRRGVRVTLWMLDSFGSKNFEVIYKDHQSMIDENLRELDRLKIPYQGIAVDLEWINLPEGDHNAEFITLMKYLRKSLSAEKELYFFASLNESDRENRKRGYSMRSLKRVVTAPMAMIYPADAGFYRRGEEVVPWLKDHRIESLRNHAHKKGWVPVFSMVDQWVAIHEDKVVLLVAHPSITEHVQLIGEGEEEYFRKHTYKAISPMTLLSVDGKPVDLSPGDVLYWFEVNRSVAGEKDLVWEYFSLKK